MKPFIFVEFSKGVTDSGIHYNNVHISDGIRSCGVKNETQQDDLIATLKEGDKINVELVPVISKGPNKTTQWSVALKKVEKVK